MESILSWKPLIYSVNYYPVFTKLFVIFPQYVLRWKQMLLNVQHRGYSRTNFVSHHRLFPTFQKDAHWILTRFAGFVCNSNKTILKGVVTGTATLKQKRCKPLIPAHILISSHWPVILIRKLLSQSVARCFMLFDSCAFLWFQNQLPLR